MLLYEQPLMYHSHSKWKYHCNLATKTQDHQDRGAVRVGQDQAVSAGRESGGEDQAAPEEERGQEEAEPGERLLHRQEDQAPGHPRRVGDQESLLISRISLLLVQGDWLHFVDFDLGVPCNVAYLLCQLCLMIGSCLSRWWNIQISVKKM